MINAWSLLYEELNGTMDKTYPVENNKLNGDNIEINTGTGDTIFNVPSDVNDLDDDIEHSDAWFDYKRNDPDRENPFTDPVDRARADYVVGLSTGFTVGLSTESVDLNSLDMSYENISIDTSNYDVYAGDALGSSGYDTLNISLPDDQPLSQNFLADNDDAAAHHFTMPPLGIETDNPRKYKEDESIKALQDYISTTYGGHYTSDNNNVQTLDLIESVGDAESFCRSNAIKYLSRYDKKGQAKRDILKALHYSLLLYHFSGQLNETPTRGYETF